MIPRDDFTPHGYLDNPYHSWKLNPSGVLRSLPPLGMGWHVPNFGSYVNNQFQYTAHLTIGLNIHDMVLVTPEDFRRHKCTVTSHLHTKNRFEYICHVPKYHLTLTARYFLVSEHALGCMLSLSTTTHQPLPITCYLIHLHTHNPGTSRLWEHGLYALENRQMGCGMLGLASEGDVFIHGARSADGTPLTWEGMAYVVSLEDVSAWARGAAIPTPNITQRQSNSGWQVRALALPCSIVLGTQSLSCMLNAALARGVSQDQACKHLEDGLEEIALAEAGHRQDDESFWQQAPQLSGDWPAYWRRGFVYDLETLRMTIRPPADSIPTPWDGMQIQAPRTVLAEAAMDTLFLSYADPALAAEVILGHFESSPHPQLPCMREDGSYNMVADDGQICGTAPEWGYPLWCCDLLFRRTGDVNWLQRLYLRAAAYLRWWLDHRRDAGGWMVYACSWESGQDVSSRFGPQQTGGTIIEHVRPVDLQASMALSAAILASWAELLSSMHTDETLPNPYLADVAFWQEIANEFTVKTRQMWQDGWFRDYDSATGEWSTERDPMHLAPIFCGAAGWEQIEQLRPTLAQTRPEARFIAPFGWPPIAMTMIGAASAASMPIEAVEMAYRFIDSAYRSIDARTLDEYGGIPGVTREYHRTVTVGKWGEIDYANAGIEGYGWGALSVHLIIRYLLGLREEEVNRLTVQPVLPQALRKAGATYLAGPLPWGRYVLHIECQVIDERRYRLRLRCTISAAASLEDTPEVSQHKTDEHACEWEGVWGEGRTIRLPDLTS
ncbi:MAG TPA: trehalase family glycosidase [Ktedonobacteraceae bacterium]|nr:trehalase family glycosidase [Ktedonobacteraceae bacterium]